MTRGLMSDLIGCLCSRRWFQVFSKRAESGQEWTLAAIRVQLLSWTSLCRFHRAKVSLQQVFWVGSLSYLDF